MTPEEIKDRLRERGLTQGDLHRAWKETRATISLLVNKKMKSQRLEKKLAKIMDVSFEQFRGEDGDAA